MSDRLKRNTGEEIEQREKHLQRERDMQQQLVNDRKKLLKMPEFQRVMADILSKGGMFQSVMTGNSHTFYHSGRQDYSREIWSELAKADQGLAFDLLKPKQEDT